MMLSVPKKANDAMHLSMLEGDALLAFDDSDRATFVAASRRYPLKQIINQAKFPC